MDTDGRPSSGTHDRHDEGADSSDEIEREALGRERRLRREDQHLLDVSRENLQSLQR